MDNDRFYVKTLTLENFRCFEKAELGPFDPHFNLIIGANGVGKSSVLLALANLFRSLAEGDGQNQFKHLLGIADGRRRRSSNVAVDVDRPWSLVGEFCSGSRQYEIQEVGPYGISLPRSALSVVGADGDLSRYSARFTPGDVPLRNQLLVLYNTNRQFHSIGRRDDVSAQDDRTLAFGNWSDAGQSANDLREWMRDQTLVALQSRNADDARGFDLDQSASKSQQALLLDLVKGAITGVLPEAIDIEYDGSWKDISTKFIDGRTLKFSSMSDGQRSLVGLVADIARRACLLSASYHGADTLLETTGLVLIDELDLHLHPRWQRQIIGALKRIFPKIQFFATTHSPQIIGEARPEEIVMLTADGKQKRLSRSFGMDSNWVLECVMEAEGRNPGVAAQIKDMFAAIEESRFGEARRLLEELRGKVGEAPDVVAADAYLWNLGAVGEEAAE